MLRDFYPEHTWLLWKFRDVNPKIFDNPVIVKKFLKYVKSKMSIKNMVEWYDVNATHLVTLGGGHLIEKYDNSIIKLLQDYYPEVTWVPWKFDKQTDEMWTPDLILEFMRWIEKDMKIESVGDWFDVSTKEFSAQGGAGLIRLYGSMVAVLRMFYPEQSWTNWQFSSNFKAYWQTLKQQQAFLKNMEAELNIRKQEEWYNVRTSEFEKYGGKGLLHLYDYDLKNYLSAMYPNYTWIPWKFARLPDNFWEKDENLKRYTRDVEEHFDIETLDGWYRVTYTQVTGLGGKGLKTLYTSLPTFLERVYPDRWWDPLRFGMLPRNSWGNVKYQKRFLTKVAIVNRVMTFDNWYCMTVQDVEEAGGVSLLKGHFNGSLVRLLVRIYPQYTFLPWKFGSVPQGWWKKRQNVKFFLESISGLLQISKPTDWYRISCGQIFKAGGGGLMPVWPHILGKIYPDVDWDYNEFTLRKKRAAQWSVLSSIKEILPKATVIEEYVAYLRGSSSKAHITFDAFIPGLNIAFEYQGEHHYIDNMFAFGPVSMQESRDSEKAALCYENGITLIPIPYWWEQGDNNALALLITKYKPELKLYVAPDATDLMEDMPIVEPIQKSAKMERLLMTPKVVSNAVVVLQTIEPAKSVHSVLE